MSQLLLKEIEEACAKKGIIFMMENLIPIEYSYQRILMKQQLSEFYNILLEINEVNTAIVA